jgi:thiol-disulfide isomerase/thioredoxin
MDAEQPTGQDVNPERPSDAAGDNTGESTVPERKPSRVAIVIAMAAVAIAILIVMLAPGADNSGAPPARSPKGNLTGSPNSAEDDAVADAKVAGKAAPLDFTLKDMNGVDVKLAAFKGKPIVMNFWATWCGPCRAEIPSLVELQKQYGDEGQDVVILGISVDDPIEKLKPYASQMKMNYPVLVGNGRDDVQDAFGPLWGIPVTVFINRDGRIAKKHSGIASKEQFEQEIKALL